MTISKSRLVTVIVLFIISSCSTDIEKSTELTAKSAKSLLRRDYPSAMLTAQKAVEYDNENFVAYNNLANAKHHLNYPFTEIESDLKEALKLKPDYEGGLISIMAFYNDHNKCEDVLKYADVYLKHYTPGHRQYNIIGEAYRATKQFDKSIEFLRKSLELDSSFWAANLNTGEWYMDNGDYKTALIYLQKAKVLKPTNPATYNEIGISYFMLGDYDSALIYVDHALRLESDPDFMINKGLFLTKVDSVLEACELFKQAEALGTTIDRIYGTDNEYYTWKIEHCDIK